jgi:hypothetical protein
MASQLAGLGFMGAVSWCTLCELFESKVDSILDMGRWLFIMVPDIDTIIIGAYQKWARAFLGADFWRNADVCASELGWVLSGYARVILAVASFRAKCWADGGWHSQFFLMSEARGCGWAMQSSAMLRKHSLLDWPQWSTTGRNVAQYREYVKDTLCKAGLAALHEGISRHSQRLPYSVLEAGPGKVPALLRSLVLPADVSCLVRHWCRLRCGLIVLRHMGGREGNAVHQSCIFCDASSAHPLVHCMALCPRWLTHRTALADVAPGPSGETNQQLAIRTLRSSLTKQGLCIVIRWAAAIDDEAYHFWHQ